MQIYTPHAKDAGSYKMILTSSILIKVNFMFCSALSPFPQCIRKIHVAHINTKQSFNYTLAATALISFYHTLQIHLRDTTEPPRNKSCFLISFIYPLSSHIRIPLLQLTWQLPFHRQPMSVEES